MLTKVFLEWENTNYTWDNLDMLWEDVAILIEVGGAVRRGGGLGSYIEGNPWDKMRRDVGEEKTKKFVKLFCKVNGFEYEEVIQLKPEIKIKTTHFETTFNESLKIGVKIDLGK
jgi:hypothetical protein